MSSKRVAANRQARLLAVQALYQRHFRGQPNAQVLRDFQDGWLTPTANADLFVFILNKSALEQARIDDIIASRLGEGWTLQRLDPVLFALLRAAVTELWQQPSTAAKALIFDYVTIARTFFDQREPAFVNKLLDGVARHLRPGELPDRPDE